MEFSVVSNNLRGGAVFRENRKSYFYFMKIKEAKSKIIRKVKEINDPDLIHSINSLLDYASKKQQEQEAYNIPESHKKLVRKRIKSMRPEQLLDWDKVQGKFRT